MKEKLKEISGLIESILYRIRYWIKVARYIRPASKTTALGMFISMVLDLPLYLVLRINPINLLGGYVYLNKYKTWFYVRPKTDDMYHITPGREGIIEKFILTPLKKGDIFVDIGANIGYYTIIAAKLVGEKGKVIAVEPIKETQRILRINSILNRINNVMIVSKAAWRTSGEKLKLYVPVLPCKVSSFGLASSNEPSNYHVFEIVETIALDDILKNCTKIKFMKIDVEGSEDKVIQGIIRALSKTNFAYIECSKANSSNIKNVLQKLGFKVIAFDVPHATHLFCIRTLKEL